MTDYKERYIKLLKSISRDGSDIDGLLKYIEESDFFIAPASTKYHNCFKQGLVMHSLNVYDVLVSLVNKYCPNRYTDDSLKIVGLLHDISKANFYIEEIKNKKVYSDKGSKYDSMGNYDWESYASYTIRSEDDRLILGTHEENSYYLVSQYIPLTIEESSAILNHHAGADNVLPQRDLSNIFNKYHLAVLLHAADFISSYLIESTYE